MTIKEKGIVIDSMDYGENGKILKLFTKNSGIISVLLRSMNRNGDLYLISQPCSVSDFTLNKGASFYYIKDADIIDSHYKLRSNIRSSSYAALMTEFVRNILFQEKKEPLIFELLLKAIDYLEVGKNPETITNGFLIKFASFSGVRPVVRSCALCGSTEAAPVAFSIDHGGIICNNCVKGTVVDEMLSKKEVIYLIKVLYLPFKDLVLLKPDLESEYKIMDLLIKYLVDNFDIRVFNSVKFIKYLRI